MILEYPSIVLEARDLFAGVFSNRPQQDNFARYLTGLYVCRRKTVSQINREFVMNQADQSSLNRWLNEAPWDARELNDERLKLMQQDPDTRYSDKGVIAIDNVLIDHDGKSIEDVGYFWDHAQERSKVAHDYLIANYVCPSGKHYPLEFSRFIKRDQCEAKGKEFKDHNVLFRGLIDWTVQRGIPGEFTADSWFASKENFNHINGYERNYVMDLKLNRKVQFQGSQVKINELSARIQPQDRRPLETDDAKQWCFTKSVRIEGVNHPVRILLIYKHKTDKEAIKALVTNRTNWEPHRIIRVYRKRWQGTECFHRDGKQELGMGDCQLRNGHGQTRHMYMTFLAYSLLVRQLNNARPCQWAQERLTTIGQACRAIMRENVVWLIDWVAQKVKTDNWDSQKVLERLALA